MMKEHPVDMLIQGMFGTIGDSVTGRINRVKQPYGGYLPRRLFDEIAIADGTVIPRDQENIIPTTVGLAVDYLTRFYADINPPDVCFQVSLQGAESIGEGHKAKALLRRIVASKGKPLTDDSVTAACQLVNYDVCIRAGAHHFRGTAQVQPNTETCVNIRRMVDRGLRFLDIYGPILYDGFTFEGDGMGSDSWAYTDKIISGDGDFITEMGLWDFKVYSSPINKNATLQILVYYLMARRSFLRKDLEYIGVYNPRMDILYRLRVDEIPHPVIDDVLRNVIGYSA